MELANGGNLEEYIQIQWESSDDSNDAPAQTNAEKIKAARTRRRARSIAAEDGTAWAPQSLTEIPATGQKEVNRQCLRHGGIGIGLKGRKVRFLVLDEIMSLFLDVCKGLAHLHEHSIIHRDLVLISNSETTKPVTSV
jgi:serine/threonine protein kinase